MKKYYTRACNFYYGQNSVAKIKTKTALPLNGNKFISFDSLEIINKSGSKIYNIKSIKKLNKKLKKKVNFDLKKITKKKFLKKISFLESPILMGVINMTPDSFSDGGKYNKKKLAFEYAKYLS